MENHATVAASPRKAQPHRLPSTEISPSGTAGPGAGAGVGVPSPFGSGAVDSASPPYPGTSVTAAPTCVAASPQSLMADSCLQRAAPLFMPGSEAAHDQLQQELRRQQQHQQQIQRQQQPPFQQHLHQQLPRESPQYHEQPPPHQQYQQQQHQQQQGLVGEASLDSRSESMRSLQGTSAQQPRPPATPEEKLRIREKYRQRVQERNVQIYQNALEEVLRKERQEATQHALFKINCPTRFGQNVYLVGSHSSLGEWAVDRALSMTWGSGNIWSVEMKLPRDAGSFEYKYIIKDGPHVIWEPGQNHVLNVEKLQKAAAAKAAKQSSAEYSAYVIEDSWGEGS